MSLVPGLVGEISCVSVAWGARVRRWWERTCWGVGGRGVLGGIRMVMRVGRVLVAAAVYAAVMWRVVVSGGERWVHVWLWR